MTQSTLSTLPAGITLEGGVMFVDEDAMRRDYAMSCANALRAMQQGRLDVAEELAPGFIQWFLSHDVAGREEVLSGMMADLTA